MNAYFLDHLDGAELRDYQLAQLEQIREALHSGFRRILCQGATGAGKTHIFCAAAREADRAGLRVLILATRTRLLRQIHERLVRFGVSHGVIAAQLPDLTNYGRHVQIASADTLHRRAFVSQTTPLPGADVVVFDEAHLAPAETRKRLLEAYPDAVVLGFTATPARRSGGSLRDLFDVLLLGPSVKDLIERKVLVRPRIFNQPVIAQDDLASIERGADGDYSAASLSQALSRPKLIGDVVGNWLRIGAGKRTMVFAVTKAHGQALTEEFRRAGVAAELLTDADDEETREAVLKRLEAGETRVVVNCFLLSYGIDVPNVEVIVLARPTRSVVMYLQSVGRGMRPAPGKETVIVIDHGRVVENLGMPTEDFGWSLEEESNVNRAAELAHARDDGAEQPRTCRDCGHMWMVSDEGNACGVCGWVPVPKAKPVRATHAELRELNADNPRLKPQDPEVLQFFREACNWYALRWPHRWHEKPNSGRAYAWHAVRERFEIPDSVRIPSRYWQVSPEATSEAVAGWMEHRLIRYIKSQRTGSG